MRSPRSHWIAGSGVFLAALLSALLVITVFPQPPVREDATLYLALARNVASGNGFAVDGQTPAVYVPPLFSGLLGVWFFLTGTLSVGSAAIFQSLVHASGILVAFLLFLEITPSLVFATGAALFLAVNPLLATRVVFVLQEPTLMLFTTLAVLLSVRWIKASSTSRAALAGVAWGICTLAKIVSWFAPFLLLAIRFLPGRPRWKWRGPEAALLLLGFAAAIAPWTVRNYGHFHRFIPVNAQGEGILEWNVSRAKIPGERPGTEYSAEVYRKGLPEKERKALLWRYVSEHPGYFFGTRILGNIARFAAPSRDWWVLRGIVRPGEHGASYWILVGLFHLPLYVLLLLRTWQWRKGSASPSLGFLVILYLAYWVEHAIIWGDPRFGLAVYPLLVAMALPFAPGEGEGGTVSAV